MKTTGKHAHETKELVATSPSLRTKIGAAAVSGCLALTLLPAFAVAAPSGNAGQEGGQQAESAQAFAGFEQEGFGAGGMQQGTAPQLSNDIQNAQAPSQSMPNMQSESTQLPTGENGLPGQMPAMPDGEDADGSQPPALPNDQDGANMSADNALPPAMGGQAPEAAGNQAPAADGQAPEGANATEGPRVGAGPNKELDEKIISAIDDEEVRALAQGGNKDVDNLRPTIPEGEVNVAQLLDAIRNGLAESQTGTAGVHEPADAANLDGQAPEGAPSMDGQAPEGAPEMNGQAPEDAPEMDGQAPEGAPEGAGAEEAFKDDTSELPLFQQILENVLEFFRNLF